MNVINENDTQNMHGYLKGNFIILHKTSYVGEENNKSIYKPYEYAVNPKYIRTLQTLKEKGTKINFHPTGEERVYESLNEILDLLEQYKNNN